MRLKTIERNSEWRVRADTPEEGAFLQKLLEDVGRSNPEGPGLAIQRELFGYIKELDETPPEEWPPPDRPWWWVEIPKGYDESES